MHTTYARQWGVRCMHEASLHEANCFITLTYAKPCWSLDYTHFQDFMRRLRARFRVRIGYYVAGEYTKLSRPHWHALLFGFDFADKYYLGLSDSGSKLYRSAQLESLWTAGFSSIGAVTFQSASYVARYCMKKVYMYDEPSVVLGIIDPDTGEIFERTREFARMSLRPAIGKRWYEKFKSDVYPHGRVVVGGQEVRPPRYYDKLFRQEGYGAYMKLAFRRKEDAARSLRETAPERLAAREAVSKARLPKGKI